MEIFCISVLAASPLPAEDSPYCNEEIQLNEKRYLGWNEKVAGKARWLHGIERLQQLVEGKILSGKNVVVAVWDGGAVQANHQDLNLRVFIKDAKGAQLPLNNHSTHVAGTIAGTGRGRTAAEGMAPAAMIWSFDFEHDLAEMKALASSTTPVAVSNHSYGMTCGWSNVCVEGGQVRWIWSGADNSNRDARFGRYGLTSAKFDEIARHAPTWTIVVSAGNSRSPLLDPLNAAKTVPEMVEYSSIAGKYIFDYDGKHYNGICGVNMSMAKHLSNNHLEGGFDSIPEGGATAKNVITVGAMEDPPYAEIFGVDTGQYRPLERKHVRTTNFSSWGPADDGRIKPDVIASGHAMLATAIPERCTTTPCTQNDATDPSDVAGYVQMSGTSMSAPIVSGVVALLNELSRLERGGQNLRSDEAKAALIQTALGPDGVEGPTYSVGWGAIQGNLAGRLLIKGQNGEHLGTVRVRADTPTKLILRRKGLRAPRVTFAWVDEEGGPQNGLDNRNSSLVNDIDMTLRTPVGNPIHPWVLDPTRPSDSATRGTNNRDNVERIDVPENLTSSKEGEWVLHLDGGRLKKGTVVEGALAIWGFELIEQ
ncbi:S8 family serine peptidase [Planctomicrobium piriforme]|nr:S8 family serine peptidase [Planctomicrobium piriforme]